MTQRVYLDHNATVPIRPEVLDTMSEVLQIGGNASSVHAEGRKARQFLEVARVELLRSKGISYKEIEDAGILLPVRNFSIKYIAPAKYDDVLFIETEIIKINGSRIEFIYEIRNQKKLLIATANTELVFVNSDTMKPTQVPTEILEFHETEIK